MGKRSKAKEVNPKVAARREARKAAQAAFAQGEFTGPLRAFAELPGEVDWVALREVVPAATATARTTKEHGDREVMVVTLLPGLLPALHRADGVILLALQTPSSSADPSRDLANALLQAIDSEPGTAISQVDLREEGPRLQDVLDLDTDFTVTIHDNFDYAVDPEEELNDDARKAMDQFSESIVPTVKIDGVEGAYWCRMTGREYLRWSRPEAEEELLDALARLHARGESALEEGTRLIGTFRSCGLAIPVWELVRGTEADELAPVLPPFEERLTKALAETGDLDADARRARASLVSRQVTLR